MKKNLVYAMMLVAAMSSCSKDSDAPSTPGTTPIDDTTPAEIQLTAGVNASVLTRGSGIVGDTIGSGNIWNGQKLKVYAYGNDVIDFSSKANFLIANKEATMRTGDWSAESATMAQTNVLRWTDREILYYPLTGSFKFYGYHVDDAFSGDPTYTTDAVTLENVTIDGTQDLMIAEATLTDTDFIRLYNNDNPGSPIDISGNISEEQKNAITAESLAKVYSAWSARREIQPNLNFKHLLSSFKFSVRPGKSSMNKVFIDSIKILGNNTANMTVVGTNRGLGTTSNSVEFYLHKMFTDGTIDIPAFDISTDPTKADMLADDRANSNTDTYLAMTENSTGTPITEYTDFGLGMMLFPGVAEYEVTIYTSERIATKEADPSDKVTYPEVSEWKFASVKTTIKAPKGGDFLAGTMYYVKLTVYDLQKIEVSATLTPWEDGGNIEENLE